VDVGTGEGKGTPGQQRDGFNSNTKQIAIGLNEKADTVDHYSFGRGGISIGVGVGVGNRHGPTVGLEKRNAGKTPVISVNRVEMVDGTMGSLVSLESAGGEVQLLHQHHPLSYQCSSPPMFHPIPASPTLFFSPILLPRPLCEY
jgi:hypothetical protein